MSTIERAAELLTSIGQANKSPSAAIDGEGDDLEQGLIERAAADVGRLANRSEGRKFVRDSGRDRIPARPAGEAARTLRVDRDLLRRQSMITPDGERTPITESFRRIKRQILANVASSKTGAPPANLVMVTSAVPGEGKTFCAVNLAISIALEVNRTVLLVDADAAKASVPRVLGFEADKGLMEVLRDRQIDVSEMLWRTDIGGLSVLPVGRAPKHATELLASDAMRELLHELAERYHDRVVIFDSPPLLAASEAGVLASQMGQIVVVVEAEKTSEAVLKNALGRIETGKIAGLLLNKGESPSLDYGYDGYG